MAMKSLGLNPAEQETIDMTNEVGNNGLVYFPEFCKIVLRKYSILQGNYISEVFFQTLETCNQSDDSLILSYLFNKEVFN